jgi:hypothetical protein
MRGLKIGVRRRSLIAVPACAAFVARMPQKRSALLICVGYVLLSCIFLVIAPTVLHFPMEFRYLLQIYPFLLIGVAIAADLLLNWKRRSSSRGPGIPTPSSRPGKYEEEWLKSNRTGNSI